MQKISQQQDIIITAYCLLHLDQHINWSNTIKKCSILKAVNCMHTKIANKMIYKYCTVIIMLIKAEN